jgi:hypothetical protein
MHQLAPSSTSTFSHAPNPIYSSVPAFAHFCKSPPFPHPRSSTLTLGVSFPSRLPNFAMSTDLVQLLKFFSPMMGESRRASRSMFGRALSGCVGVRGTPKREGRLLTDNGPLRLEHPRYALAACSDHPALVRHDSVSR